MGGLQRFLLNCSSRIKGSADCTVYWIDAHPNYVAAAELVEAGRFWAKRTKQIDWVSPAFPRGFFTLF